MRAIYKGLYRGAYIEGLYMGGVSAKYTKTTL